MAGLDPAIHALVFVFPGKRRSLVTDKGVDARVKPGHDEE